MTDSEQEHRDHRAQRALSFGTQAASYEINRPPYPPAAVRWGLRVAPGADAAGMRVLDLGAGTGKLTRALVALGADVVAVEPDPQMLAQLRRGLPGVESHAGRAEAIPLPDASVDAVAVGQALQWFDTDRAMPQIARVLRPGGVLTGLWNADDHTVDWVAGLARIEGRAVQPLRETFAGDDAVELPGFPHSDGRLFDNAHRRTAESLTSTMATRSAVAVLPDAERAARLAEIRAYLASVPQTARGEFDMPLVTMVHRWWRE
jgi:SAM-dependent methyltransferase